VEDGVADIGIVGENVLYEKNKALMWWKNSASEMRLSVAIPAASNTAA